MVAAIDARISSEGVQEDKAMSTFAVSKASPLIAASPTKGIGVDTGHRNRFRATMDRPGGQSPDNMDKRRHGRMPRALAGSPQRTSSLATVRVRSVRSR